MACAQRMPDSARFNVFLRPPPEIDARLEALAGALERRGLRAFRTAGLLPHLTLFLAPYPRNVFPQVRTHAAAVAFESRQVLLRTLTVRASGDWLFVDVANTSVLLDLNLRLAAALAPLRDAGAPAPEHARGKPDLLRSFAEFGSPRVGATFRPHFSLAHVAGGADALARFAAEISADPLLRVPVRGTSLELAVGEADDDGQVAAAAATFGLPATGLG